MASQSPTVRQHRVVPISSTHKGNAAMSPLKSFVNRYFYFAMSLLIAIIVVSGFRLTIDGNLLHPPIPRPLILWFHAAAFSGWVAFFSSSPRSCAPTTSSGIASSAGLAPHWAQ